MDVNIDDDFVLGEKTGSGSEIDGEKTRIYWKDIPSFDSKIHLQTKITTREQQLRPKLRKINYFGINSFRLSSLPTPRTKTLQTFKFMRTLASQLTRPHMERRERMTTIQRDIRLSLCVLQFHLNVPVLPDAVGNSAKTPARLTIRNYCSLCDPKTKRKIQYLWLHCKKPICLGCSQMMCANGLALLRKIVKSGACNFIQIWPFQF